MSLSQAKQLYKGSGHEVAVHGVAHQAMRELPDAQVVWETIRDRENLEREFGGIIRGMAYAMGIRNAPMCAQSQAQVEEKTLNWGIAPRLMPRKLKLTPARVVSLMPGMAAFSSAAN